MTLSSKSRVRNLQCLDPPFLTHFYIKLDERTMPCSAAAWPAILLSRLAVWGNGPKTWWWALTVFLPHHQAPSYFDGQSIIKAFWSHFGPFTGHLGSHLGFIWDYLRVIRDNLDVLWDHLGVIWYHCESQGWQALWSSEVINTYIRSSQEHVRSSQEQVLPLLICTWSAQFRLEEWRK